MQDAPRRLALGDQGPLCLTVGSALLWTRCAQRCWAQPDAAGPLQRCSVVWVTCGSYWPRPLPAPSLRHLMGQDSTRPHQQGALAGPGLCLWGGVQAGWGRAELTGWDHASGWKAHPHPLSVLPLPCPLDSTSLGNNSKKKKCDSRLQATSLGRTLLAGWHQLYSVLAPPLLHGSLRSQQALGPTPPSWGYSWLHRRGARLQSGREMCLLTSQKW